VYLDHCLLPTKQGFSEDVFCTHCYDAHHRVIRTIASVMLEEAKAFDTAIMMGFS
jgi:hypothetical protein